LAIAASLSSSGCGDDATQPGPDVNGTWEYNATNIAGTGVSCGISGITMNLSQSGSTFTGTYSPGSVTCTGPGGTFTDQFDPGVVANGSLIGNNVSFDFDTSDMRHTGTLAGNSISGTVTVRGDLGDPIGEVTLTGPFAAVRR
jgi:hypothetical protein